MTIEELIERYGEPEYEGGTDDFYEMEWTNVYVLLVQGEIHILIK